MITAVCFNPCVDRTISISKFTYGGMNRVQSSRSDASGKGINVAIVAAQLGEPARCVGFLYRENGALVEQRLKDNGVEGDFVWLEGRLRTNIKLYDAQAGVITEINEAGVPVGEGELERAAQLVRRCAQAGGALVLTGSLPPGCPAGFYRTLIEQVRDTGCRTVLDAEGERLEQGVLAQPFLIKPNLYELEMSVGHKLDCLAQVRDAALRYVEKGVSVVAVSMGGEGALITDGRQTLYAPVVPVQVRSTVGAGDSMVAGLMVGFERGAGLQEAFRMGVASATASVMSEGTQLVDPAEYRRQLDRVVLKPV